MNGNIIIKLLEELQMSEVPLISTENRLNCYKARTFQKNFLKNTKEAEQLKSAPLRYD